MKHKMRELGLPTGARGIEPALVSATLAAELAAARTAAGAMCEAASDARERSEQAANWPRQPQGGGYRMRVTVDRRGVMQLEPVC